MDQDESDEEEDYNFEKCGFIDLYTKVEIKLNLRMVNRYVDRTFMRILYVVQLMLCDTSLSLTIYHLLVKNLINPTMPGGATKRNLKVFYDELYYEIQIIVYDSLFPFTISDIEMGQIPTIKRKLEAKINPII